MTPSQIRKLSSFACLALLTTASLPAQTLKDRSNMDADRKEVAESAKHLNETCGSNIKISVDYDSYMKGAGGVDEQSHAPYQYCQNASDAVDLTCRHSDAGKQAVLAKIKTITCSYGDAQAVSMDGTNLHYTVGFHGGNSDFVNTWLANHL